MRGRNTACGVQVQFRFSEGRGLRELLPLSANAEGSYGQVRFVWLLRGAGSVDRIVGRVKEKSMSRKPWDAEEVELVRKLYPHTRTDEIAKRFGCAVSRVYNLAFRLGLKKSAEFLASPEGCRFRRGYHVGWEYRFPKGHVPMNKGLRRPGWSPGRMKETQFRRGERRGKAAENYQPLGTISKDSEGFLRIKVRDAEHGEHTGFGNVKVWPLLNRHLWEQHNGPIPTSHAVCFKDRNRENCDISNLELVSRQDLMKRNSVHKLPKELAQVIQLRGALNRKIRRLNAEQNV
jgi:hypothetical protein